MGKRCVKSKNFQESNVSYVIKLRFLQICSVYMKDAILVWFTTAIKRLFKVVQTQKRLQIEKSAGIAVAGNLVTDMGSASRFELALFMRKLLTR